MFVITNRQINENASGLDVFGDNPNPQGPNELRMLEVSGTTKFTVTRFPDEPLPKAKLKELEETFKKWGLKLDRNKAWYPSLEVACGLFQQARKTGKQLLFFVHGYNNDMGDVLRTARTLEKLYNVIVVPFSWPANGGGKISGTVAYLSDKEDARASATALHRAVQKISAYHRLLTANIMDRHWEAANAKHPDNRELAQGLYMELVNKDCKATINLMCHSMGNYVLKHACQPGTSSLRQLAFDNVSLIAADANNPNHETWVETIPVRNRLYVFINENDGALKWSRRKPGDEQLERLGHHLRNLRARNAYYIDVTKNRGVDSEHSYFKGTPVQQNKTLKGMFARAFEGGIVEADLEYHADLNLYRS